MSRATGHGTPATLEVTSGLQISGRTNLWIPLVPLSGATNPWRDQVQYDQLLDTNIWRRSHLETTKLRRCQHLGHLSLDITTQKQASPSRSANIWARNLKAPTPGDPTLPLGP